jgi:hypothetical protein
VVIELTAPVVKREVKPKDFSSVVERGDLTELLHNFVIERLREFELGAPHRRLTTSLDRRRDGQTDSYDISRELLKDMTQLTREATAVINARNEFNTAKITAATTQQRAELEYAKLTSAVLEQRAIQAEYETRIDGARVEAEVERRLRERVETDLAPRYAEAEDLTLVAEERFREADRKLEKADRRIDEAMSLKGDIVNLLNRVEGVHVERSKRREQRRDDEERRQQRERKRLEHFFQVEELKTRLQQQKHQQQVDRARLKRRLAGATDPQNTRIRRDQNDQGRALEQIKAQLRDFTNEAERIAYARREVDKYLKRVADEHGTDSPEYETAVAHADTFTRRIVDEQAGLHGEEEDE